MILIIFIEITLQNQSRSRCIQRVLARVGFARLFLRSKLPRRQGGGKELALIVHRHAGELADVLFKLLDVLHNFVLLSGKITRLPYHYLSCILLFYNRGDFRNGVASGINSCKRKSYCSVVVRNSHPDIFCPVIYADVFHNCCAVRLGHEPNPSNQCKGSLASLRVSDLRGNGRVSIDTIDTIKGSGSVYSVAVMTHSTRAKLSMARPVSSAAASHSTCVLWMLSFCYLLISINRKEAQF